MNSVEFAVFIENLRRKGHNYIANKFELAENMKQNGSYDIAINMYVMACIDHLRNAGYDMRPVYEYFFGGNE